MHSKGRFSFYWVLILDIFSKFFPRKRIVQSRERSKISSNLVTVFIHEWGGYKLRRIKQLPLVKDFECGLFFQLLRFNRELLPNIKLYVTISEPEKLDPRDKKYIKQNSEKVYYVSNIGMDFSGYSTAYNHIKHNANHYVILTNSSVNSHIDYFLTDYIKYMESNRDVGALGISCNSRYTQTLFKNNFTPHIQSFFILTTVDVLNELVQSNNGQFPGANITEKRLLIREGEIKFSQLLLDLGYKLAVVLESGIVYKFDRRTTENEFPYGDMRIASKNPNKITPIQNKDI